MSSKKKRDREGSGLEHEDDRHFRNVDVEGEAETSDDLLRKKGPSDSKRLSRLKPGN